MRHTRNHTILVFILHPTTASSSSSSSTTTTSSSSGSRRCSGLFLVRILAVVAHPFVLVLLLRLALLVVEPALWWMESNG
jgi:hypothetical protein